MSSYEVFSKNSKARYPFDDKNEAIEFAKKLVDKRRIEIYVIEHGDEDVFIWSSCENE